MDVLIKESIIDSAWVVVYFVARFIFWTETALPEIQFITNNNTFIILLLFFIKTVFTIFLQLGIFRGVGNSVQKISRIEIWFMKTRIARSIQHYKERLIKNAIDAEKNSALLFWKLLFLLIVAILVFLPYPYTQASACGLYVAVHFKEKNGTVLMNKIILRIGWLKGLAIFVKRIYKGLKKLVKRRAFVVILLSGFLRDACVVLWPAFRTVFGLTLLN